MKILTNIADNKKNVLIGILIFALIPRLLLLIKTTTIGLGVDELQSAIHAFLPLKQLLKSVQTFDPHPPLFYLQLHFWEKVGTSDSWLMMNPFLWNMLSVLSLLILGKKVFCFKVGVFASLFLALSPISVTYSVGLRMYGLLIFASIWVWYFTHQFFISNKRRTAGVGIFISTFIFLYSQGAGFIILSSGVVYATLLVAKSWKRNWQLFAKYLLVQGIVIVSYIPWLLRARTINLAHPKVPDLTDIVQTLSQLLFGWFIYPSSNVQVILATIFFSLLFIILLLHKSSRKIVLSFIIVPILACIVISYTIKPIWLTYTLIQISAFLSLGVGLVVADWIQDQRLIRKNIYNFIFEVSMIVVIVIGSLIGLIYNQYKYYSWTPLKESAELIQENLDDVDVVYIPNERMYWGWSWYYFGPGHITPTTNYMMVQDGVTIVSRPTVATLFGNEREEQSWWIIYRESDDFGALSSEVEISDLTPVETYHNVTVGKIDINAITKP